MPNETGSPGPALELVVNPAERQAQAEPIRRIEVEVAMTNPSAIRLRIDSPSGYLRVRLDDTGRPGAMSRLLDPDPRRIRVGAAAGVGRVQVRLVGEGPLA